GRAGWCRRRGGGRGRGVLGGAEGASGAGGAAGARSGSGAAAALTTSAEEGEQDEAGEAWAGEGAACLLGHVLGFRAGGDRERVAGSADVGHGVDRRGVEAVTGDVEHADLLGGDGDGAAVGVADLDAEP